MSTTTFTTGTTSTTRPQFAARVPVWAYSIAVVLAGAVVTGVYEAAARAVGIPFNVAFPGAEPAAIPATGLAWAVAELGLVGVILAAGFHRFAKAPRSTWKRTTWTLTVLSCVPSAIAATDSYATNVMLIVSHVIAASVIIPMVAARLPERR